MYYSIKKTALRTVFYYILAISKCLSFATHNQFRCQLGKTDYFTAISRYIIFCIFLELKRKCLLAHRALNLCPYNIIRSKSAFIHTV